MNHSQSIVAENTKVAGVLDAPSTAQYNKAKKQDTTTKNYAMMSVFVSVGLRGLNRFEASKHHDSVLNSTICTLQKKYGVYFSREWEKVPNFTGGLTNVVRYWLDKENMAIALAALEGAEVSNE